MAMRTPREPATQANAVRRVILRFTASSPGSRLFASVLHHVDRPVSRITGGRHTLTSVVTGLPIATVTTTGNRSGQPRSVPLVALPTPGGLAVIGSNYGQAHHPGWVHNLRADPRGTVTVDGHSWKFRAVEVEASRRERIWELALQTYPGFAAYEQRAAPRRISVFVLEPV